MSLMVNDIFRNKAKRSPEQVQALANTVGEINDITEPLESAVWLFEKIAYLVASAWPHEAITKKVSDDLTERGYDIDIMPYPHGVGPDGITKVDKTVERLDSNEVETDVHFQITEGRFTIEFVSGVPVVDYKSHMRQESFSVKVKTGGIILLYKSFTREVSV